MKYYAYLWLRVDGTPYYAGKGMAKRAYAKENHICPPPEDKSRIVLFYRATEQEAIETEMELIRNWGRKDIGTGCLRNFTDGGDGSSGYKHTPKAKQRMAELKRGKKLSLAHKKKLSLAGKGRAASAETRQKRSAAMLGRKMSPESCAKMSAAKTGKPLSEKHKSKLSAARQGMVFSDEHRANLAVAARGNKNGNGHRVLPAARTKISQALRGNTHTKGKHWTQRKIGG